MAEKSDKKTGAVNKKKTVIFILLAVVLVALAVVSVYFATRSQKGAPVTTADGGNETVSEILNVTVPAPTEAPVSLKNYTFYIDTLKFDSKEEDGVTTLTAKNQGGAKMTVTPLKSTAYSEHCELLKSELGEGEKLPLDFENSGFGNSGEDSRAVAYCVDDKNGGCVEIRYTVPEGDTESREEFEIMLTMFKIL